MGMFAEAVIVSFCLSFAKQGKRTPVIRFRLQQRNGSLPFPFSVCRKQMGVANFC
jgi:hypothetical protein